MRPSGLLIVWLIKATGMRMALTRGIILVGMAAYTLTKYPSDHDLVPGPDHLFNALNAHLGYSLPVNMPSDRHGECPTAILATKHRNLTSLRLATLSCRLISI